MSQPSSMLSQAAATGPCSSSGWCRSTKLMSNPSRLGLAQQDGLPDCTGEVVRSDTYVGKTRIDAVTCRKLLRDNPGALNVVSQPNWEFYQS